MPAFLLARAALSSVQLRQRCSSPLVLNSFVLLSKMASSSSSSSVPSVASKPSFLPERPTIVPITVGRRIYRQVLVPRPPGATRLGSASFTSSASSSSSSSTSSFASSSSLPGTPVSILPASAPSPRPLSSALLTEVREIESTSPSSSVLTLQFSLSVNVPPAALPSLSSSPQLQQSFDKIQQKHQTTLLIPTLHTTEQAICQHTTHYPSSPSLFPPSCSSLMSALPSHLFRAAVRGGTRETVVWSAREVQEVIDMYLDKLPYSHFLCLPLPCFIPNFQELKFSILSSLPSTPGLHPSIFVRPTSLHLTLAMLHLTSPALIRHAATILSSLHSTLADLLTSPLLLHLRTLSTFQSPSHSHVIFIQPDSSHPCYDRLTQVCRLLIEGMIAGGVLSERECRKQRLIKDGQLTVKLHVTCINTKHRAAGEEGGGRGQKGKWVRRQPVDAVDLFRQYGNVDWGEGPVDRCEISELSWDETTNFYPCKGRLDLRP